MFHLKIKGTGAHIFHMNIPLLHSTKFSMSQQKFEKRILIPKKDVIYGQITSTKRFIFSQQKDKKIFVSVNATIEGSSIFNTQSSHLV